MLPVGVGSAGGRLRGSQVGVGWCRTLDGVVRCPSITYGTCDSKFLRGKVYRCNLGLQMKPEDLYNRLGSALLFSVVLMVLWSLSIALRSVRIVVLRALAECAIPNFFVIKIKRVCLELQMEPRDMYNRFRNAIWNVKRGHCSVQRVGRVCERGGCS